MKPRLLDLFAGAGGAARGYQLAGFHVTGIDHRPNPRYAGDAFIQADVFVCQEGNHKAGIAEQPLRWVLPVDLSEFDAIHASPPCQAYSITKHSHKKQHPDLLPATREMLRRSGRPWILENVPGAPMPAALVLCGASFGLKAFDPASGRELWLQRHRWFESNVALWALPHNCKGKEIGGVYGGGSVDRSHARNVRRGGYTPAAAAVRSELMGIDWMQQDRLNQAIPPAMTEYLGAQLLDFLSAKASTP